MENIKLSLECGYELTYADDVLDDMEIFDLMVELVSAAGLSQERTLHQIFEQAVGSEQIEGLKQYLKEKDGKVKRTEYTKAANEFIKSVSANKKK